MIFDKTKQAMKDFDSTMAAAKDSYGETKQSVLATYTEAIATEKLKEAQTALHGIEVKAKESAREAIKADFAEVRSQVNETVTASIPADFVATLEAVKALGSSVTDAEASGYLEKYKGNYMAFRSLLEVLHLAGRCGGIMAVTPDSIYSHIDEGERIVLEWIQNYKGNDYMSALMTSDAHTPINNLVTNVQAFLNGGYAL